MTLTKSGSKLNTSSRKVSEEMTKMLLPSIIIFIGVDKMKFDTVNTDKPCRKKNKEWEKLPPVK